MSPRSRFDYFAAYKRQAEFCETMAQSLRAGMESGQLGTRALVDSLHAIENDADRVNHEIQSHLLSDFMVPLDRDGMSGLAHTLDDVVDAVEQIAIQAYIFGISQLPHECAVMASMLVYACADLKTVVFDLQRYTRRSSDIQKRLVKVQTYESDCDRIYIEAAHDLYADKSAGAQAVRLAHAMLDTVEEAMDAVENAAERVQTLVVQSV
jgi:uncharacterized protein